MYTSTEIANFFIQRSQATGGELTPMKLIKLTYIAHGWHLGLYDTALLDETVYAWKYGPVIKSLYQNFRGYGNSQISEACRVNGEYPTADKSAEPFLNQIWELYKGYSGTQLSTMTHQSGTPWDIVWNQHRGKERLDAVIPNDIIKQHYKDKLSAANGTKS